jgi:fused signal recognition particle receptor
MLDLFKRKPAEEEREKRPWTERLAAGLARSREKLAGAIGAAFARRKLDDETLEALESALLTADVGIAATQHLLDDLSARWKRAGGEGDPKAHLKAALLELIAPLEKPLVITDARPFVIMLAGVNGAGKTTSIGKLARLYQQQGHSVLLAAGDTFRAAAREQLTVWGERNGVTVISQAGGDPGAVMFDAIAAARARAIDVVLADTAGRLPTQLQLMDEIRKVQRVIRKADPAAPHETLLVVDANTGQNTLAQVKAFDDALGLTGLVLTKLDGSAKGGIVAAIAKERPIPLRYIGVGEGIDDLKPFVSRDFVEALVG